MNAFYSLKYKKTNYFRAIADIIFFVVVFIVIRYYDKIIRLLN